MPVKLLDIERRCPDHILCAGSVSWSKGMYEMDLWDLTMRQFYGIPEPWRKWIKDELMADHKKQFMARMRLYQDEQTADVYEAVTT